ncbi:hypothetical protein ABFZ85_14690 [Hyphococcus formosus]|uniref:hypothetical protein n=1 Tax=Hyphococcus formosus TaxID=3143534 RepID=UPI00398A83C5
MISKIFKFLILTFVAVAFTSTMAANLPYTEWFFIPLIILCAYAIIKPTAIPVLRGRNGALAIMPFAILGALVALTYKTDLELQQLRTNNPSRYLEYIEAYRTENFYLAELKKLRPQMYEDVIQRKREEQSTKENEIRAKAAAKKAAELQMLKETLLATDKSNLAEVYRLSQAIYKIESTPENEQAKSNAAKQYADQLWEEVRKIPVSQYEKNLDIYTKLAAVDPTQKVKEKQNFYLEKIRLIEEQERYPHNFVVIKNLIWRKTGFGSIAEIDLLIRNDLQRNVKDVSFSCTLRASSGTIVGTKKDTILEVFPAQESKWVVNFSLGFIDKQASNMECLITSVK